MTRAEHYERSQRTAPIALTADLQPAYTAAKPRTRQSDIDRRQAWKAADVRTIRAEQPRKSWVQRVLGRGR